MKRSDFPKTHNEVEALLKAMNQWKPEDHMEFNAKNAAGLQEAVQMALCTYQSGASAIYKKFDGSSGKKPFWCYICPKCLQKQADGHQKKFNEAESIARKNKPDGQWRMKLVDKNSTEGDSLKKRISRNQQSSYMTVDSIDHPGKEEIWSFAENEPGKDTHAMDTTYGSANTPAMNFDKINRQNKITGSKITYAKGIRPPSKGPGEKDTVKMMVPEAIIKSEEDQKRAESIIKNTNLLELATDAKNAQHLIILQFQYILIQLEKENIPVEAVRDGFYNINEEELLRQWNDNVNGCLSLYNALLEKGEALTTDMLEMVKRFYQPISPEKTEKLAA